MKIIDKIYISKYVPSSTGVLWIDLSDSSKWVTKVYLNGSWQPTQDLDKEALKKIEAIVQNYQEKIIAGVGVHIAADGKTISVDEGYGNVVTAGDVSYDSTRDTQVGSIGAKVTSLSSQIDQIEEDKADADGYYGEMGVGCADELAPSGSALSMSFVKQKTAAGATAQGKAEMKTIKGKTLKVVQYANVSSKSFEADKIVTDTLAALNVKAGHKYLYSAFQDNALSSVVRNTLMINANGVTYESSTDNYHLSAGIHYMLYTATEDVYANFTFWAHTPNADYSISKIQLFDLTAMFGAGNEPASVAAFATAMGYASINDVPYIGYTEGSLVNLTAKSIRTQGRNLWDEEWEQSGSVIKSKNYTKVDGSKSYFFVSPTAFQFYWYDENKTQIGTNGVSGNSALNAMPSNCKYLKFVGIASYGNTYKNDVCIAEGSTAVAYEPYKTATKTLPILDHFADGMKSAGSVYDEMTKTKAITRVGKVDLGSLTWATSTYGYYFWDNNNVLKAKISASIASQKYIQHDVETKGENYIQPLLDNTIIGFKVSSNEPPTGILYYELATPTEEDITEDLTYTAYDGGTEEILTDTQTAPLTADIVYNLDVVATLKKLLAAAITNGWTI